MADPAKGGGGGLAQKFIRPATVVPLGNMVKEVLRQRSDDLQQSLSVAPSQRISRDIRGP